VTVLRLGVIGYPIAHSLSPVMHRAALAALGRTDVTYDAIEVAPSGLADALARLAHEGYVGLNVTLPHKTGVMAHLAAIDADARAIGAVNTLVRADGAWIGSNTDAIGLARALAEESLEVAGARAVVLGAGGAARAAVVALADAPELVVAARRSEVAHAVAALHPRGHAISLEGLADAFASADLVVQATSATLGPEAAAFAATLPLERLRPHAVVVDLVYRPRETAVLARARARGLRVVDGIGMLVHQGAASLERWIGRRPSTDVMRAAVLSAL
jgi:shikimate dehydrogenase